MSVPPLALKIIHTTSYYLLPKPLSSESRNEITTTILVRMVGRVRPCPPLLIEAVIAIPRGVKEREAKESLAGTLETSTEAAAATRVAGAVLDLALAAHTGPRTDLAVLPDPLEAAGPDQPGKKAEREHAAAAAVIRNLIDLNQVEGDLDSEASHPDSGLPTPHHVLIS
jgi:hypothetical protein